MSEGLNVAGTNVQTVDDKNSLNINNGKNSSTLDLYHKSEIGQNKMIITNAVIMIWVGIGVLIIGAISYLFTDVNILILISGGFIDLFSGTMIFLVNKSSSSKEKYFKDLSAQENKKNIIELITDIKDDEKKYELISQIVQNDYKK